LNSFIYDQFEYYIRNKLFIRISNATFTSFLSAKAEKLATLVGHVYGGALLGVQNSLLGV